MESVCLQVRQLSQISQRKLNIWHCDILEYYFCSKQTIFSTNSKENGHSESTLCCESVICKINKSTFFFLFFSSKNSKLSFLKMHVFLGQETLLIFLIAWSNNDWLKQYLKVLEIDIISTGFFLWCFKACYRGITFRAEFITSLTNEDVNFGSLYSYEKINTLMTSSMGTGVSRKYSQSTKSNNNCALDWHT